MDEPTALVCASLFLCYMYWWVALSVMRYAQFTASAAAKNLQSSSVGAADDYVPEHSATASAADAGPRPVKYDNKDQSESKMALTGYGKRALLAMNNHAEQLPHFGLAAVLNIAVRGGVAPWPAAIVMACIAAARGLHLATYLADMDGVRSAAFAVSGGLTIALYALVFA